MERLTETCTKPKWELNNTCVDAPQSHQNWPMYPAHTPHFLNQAFYPEVTNCAAEEEAVEGKGVVSSRAWTPGLQATGELALLSEESEFI